MISVIVPVYNVEAYLSKCIESIINQTYDDLEIILVDDGSPDKSGEICDEYAKKDSRIKVIHKENGGLSSARNAGINAANGDLIGFVDSDDYIHPEMYERMYNAIEKEKADLCMCSFKMVNQFDIVINSTVEPIQNEVLSREECFVRLFGPIGWQYVTVPMKLYKKNLFNSLRFEEGKLHEDEFLIHHLFGKCNTVVTVSDELYFYVQREGSIMHTKSTMNEICTIEAFFDRYKYLKSCGYKNLAKTSLYISFGRLFSLLKTGYPNEFAQVIKKRVKLVHRALITVNVVYAIKLLLGYLLRGKLQKRRAKNEQK